jgi:hypothetical protein
MDNGQDEAREFACREGEASWTEERGRWRALARSQIRGYQRHLILRRPRVSYFMVR